MCTIGQWQRLCLFCREQPLSLRPTIIILQGYETHAAVALCIMANTKCRIKIPYHFWIVLSHRHTHSFTFNVLYDSVNTKDKIWPHKKQRSYLIESYLMIIFPIWRISKKASPIRSQKKRKSLTTPQVHLFQQTRWGYFPGCNPSPLLGHLVFFKGQRTKAF